VVMPRSRVDELPLNGRNFQDLVELQAGVVNAPSSAAGGRGGISRSGIPFNVTSGSDFVGNGRSAGQRPDVIFGVDPYVKDLGTQTWLTSAAFNTAALKAEKRFGNLGFDALAGPRAFTMDSGLYKNFQITERQKITFRLETFNTLNHTVFSSPNGTLNNANFGRILSARSPRAYQIALKYVF
jgi:hypothetical protein